MRNLYLVLTIAGFIIPNIFTAKVSIETGNWLFYAKPMDTIQALLTNDTVIAFSLDLFCAVFVFFIWSFFEGRKHNIPNVWMYWVLSLLFGIAGPLPLFLYQREKRIAMGKTAFV